MYLLNIFRASVCLLSSSTGIEKHDQRRKQRVDINQKKIYRVVVHMI
jgi:hypothetical protein